MEQDFFADVITYSVGLRQSLLFSSATAFASSSADELGAFAGRQTAKFFWAHRSSALRPPPGPHRRPSERSD
ncbi:hypothetical protein TYRP_023672, partial [Tyrophagus putrescentiae]